jgi:MFS family permease
MSRIFRSINDTIVTTYRNLWADGTGWILLAVSAGWALSIGLRFVYPALVPALQTEFSIDFTTTGLLLTVLWASYALGHVPGGALGDRLGEGVVLVISGVLSTIAVLLLATAPTLGLLFTATILFGLATALYGPTRFTILTDLYSKEAGSAVGLTMAAGSIGNAVFPALAVFIAGALSWRFGFGIFLPMFAIVTITLWFLVPNRTSTESNAVDELSLDLLRKVSRGITVKNVPVVVGVQVTLSFMIQGFSSFYPVYLVEAKRLSPELAATLFGGFFLLGAVIQPVMGILMDRIGVRATIILCLSACVSALALLPLVDSLVTLVTVTGLFAFWNGAPVVTQTYIAETLPADMQGTGFGMLKAGWMLIGATAPALVGLMADIGRFDEAFLLLAAIGTVGLVLSLRYL